MDEKTSEAINRVVSAQQTVLKTAERLSSRLYLLGGVAVIVAFFVQQNKPMDDRLAGTFVFALVVAVGVFFLRHVFLIKHAAPRQEEIEKLKAVPENAADYLARGTILIEWGQSEAAILDFEEVLRLDPENENAEFQLGEAYYDLELYDKALERFEKIIPLDNGYLAAAHFYRGLISEKKFSGTGEADFRKASELAPRDPDILFKYAEFLIERDRIDDAAELLANPALEMEMQHYPELHEVCGTIFAKRGEFDNAVASYTRAIKLGARTKELYRLRADAYEKAGNRDLAERDRARSEAVKDDLG